jgi:putative drug exporter of the RND superfamily
VAGRGNGKGDGNRDGAGARSRFYRLGGFAYRRRWAVVAVWVAAVVAAGPFLGKLTERLSQGGFEVPGSQSFQVKQALESDFHLTNINDSLVMHSDTLTVTDDPFRATFDRVKAALSDAPGVIGVSDPYSPTAASISRDGHTLTATVSLSGSQNDALKNADVLNEAVAKASRGSGVTALLTGAAPFYSEFSKTTNEDLKNAESIALPISLLILILAFGSLVAAGMPLALAVLSLLISFGVISAIAAVADVSLFTENIASMIGIGVGIDYSLFILTRFREELRGGRDAPDAISLAIASSGKAVFVSALTVVVALSGTQLVNIQAFRSMGWGAMIAVAIAAAAALTLLPALLGVVRERVNFRVFPWLLGRVGLGRLAERLPVRRTGESRLWHRWATAVMRRPWLALTGSLAVLLLLATPALHLRMGSSGPSILPPDSSPRVASEIAAKAFGEGQVAPVQIVVSDPRGVTRGAAAFAVCKLSRDLAADPELVPGGVHSFATLVPGQDLHACVEFAAAPLARTPIEPFLAKGGTETLISVVTKHGAQSDESNAFVERARREIADLLPSGAPTRALVGGDPGLNVDINNEVSSKLVPVVALVMILSFLVLMVFFRSLLLPLKAVLMNTASVLAVYGLLVFVFQDGHLEGLLNFQAAGHIESFLPLFLFCILFGLSMDYEVFLLARIREEYLKTGDNTEAVGWGLEHTAAIITSAALIMVTVFGAFAFASLVPIKSMGFGLAMAVLIDATIVRVILVPAAMRLMGRGNWWLPNWLDKRIPQVSLEGTDAKRVHAGI